MKKLKNAVVIAADVASLAYYCVNPNAFHKP